MSFSEPPPSEVSSQLEPLSQSTRASADSVPSTLRWTADRRYVLWDGDKDYAKSFLEWWETTHAAERIAASRTEREPSWNSKARTEIWLEYEQCALPDGDPFVRCKGCGAYLKHPIVYNYGTSTITHHKTTRACIKKRTYSHSQTTIDSVVSKVSAPTTT